MVNRCIITLVKFMVLVYHPKRQKISYRFYALLVKRFTNIRHLFLDNFPIILLGKNTFLSIVYSFFYITFAQWKILLNFPWLYILQSPCIVKVGWFVDRNYDRNIVALPWSIYPGNANQNIFSQNWLKHVQFHSKLPDCFRLKYRLVAHL